MNDIKCKRLNKIFKFVMTAAVVMIMLCAAPVMEHFGIDMGVSAHAAKSGYFTYEVKYNTAVITKVEYSSGGNISIPDTLGGYPVTALENDAFYLCDIDTLTFGKYLTKFYPNTFYGSFIKKFAVHRDNEEFTTDDSGCLFNGDGTVLYKYPTGNERISYTVPQGVENIYYDAFCHATYLQNIVLPESLKKISNSAFAFCLALSEINIPKNVETIDDFAFYNCNMISSITIPEKCEYIGQYAFYTCLLLSEISIPKSVEKIGEGAFQDCILLTKINVYGKDTIIDKNAIGKTEMVLNNQKNLMSLIENYVFWSFSYVFGQTDLENYYFSEVCKYANFYDSPQPHGIIYCYNGSTAEEYDIDYKYIHTYKTKTTKATTSKNGKVVKACTVCGDVKSSKTIYKISSIKLSATSYTYNGKVKTPSVVIKDSKGNKLVKGTDYTVKYSSGRKAVGTYKVKITFMGKYSGTKTLSFKIVLGKVTEIKSARSGSKTTISWNKVTGATGYVVYEYNKNTDKYNKLGTFKTNSIKNNYSGRKATLKIKAYYKAKDGTVHYGAYSAKTTVKI